MSVYTAREPENFSSFILDVAGLPVLARSAQMPTSRRPPFSPFALQELPKQGRPTQGPISGEALNDLGNSPSCSL